MGPDWNIKGRADRCAATDRPFAEGEYFYTLLFHGPEGFSRQDISEEAWQARNDNIAPFSFWRSKFEPLPEAPPEPLPRGTAEDLLRRLIADNDPARLAAIYILAVMLERKRILKQIETRSHEGAPLLVYEHVKTGEVFVVRDPQLRLDQLDGVQTEVAQLLG
jgi:hypothetical protein